MSDFKALAEKMIWRTLYRLNMYAMHSGRKHSKGALILAYHEITRPNFEDHVQYLISAGYRIISMDMLSDWFHQNHPVPDKAVVITFDDGWKSNYTEVHPVARQYRIPVLIYIISRIYAADFKPWFFVLAELKSSGITDIPESASLLRVTGCKRNRMAEHVKQKYGASIIRSHSLSLEEILEMQGSGYVCFGSHTATHPNLSQASEKTVRLELGESRDELETLLGRKVVHLAYPGGNFFRTNFPSIGDAGYLTAVTIRPGRNHPAKGTHPYALRRICMSAGDDVTVLAAKLSGLWHTFHRKKWSYI